MRPTSGRVSGDETVKKKTAVIGITGGVGAGKSTVLDYIADNYDALILKTDEIAHDVMEPGSDCYERLREILPDEAFGRSLSGEETDRSIDRQALARLLFADDPLREEINALVHPAVGEELSAIVKKEKKQNRLDYVIIESALYTGGGFALLCDEVWNVTAAENVRIDRLMKDRGYTRDKAVGIIESQAVNDRLSKTLSIQIDNSADFDRTKEQIETELERVRQSGARS